MKMKLFCLVMVFVGLILYYVVVVDGMLYFLGIIVNLSCKLVSGNEKGFIEVKMGVVLLFKLKNDINGIGLEVGVNISVKDCEVGMYYIVFDGVLVNEVFIINVLVFDVGNFIVKKVGIKLIDCNNILVMFDKFFDFNVDLSIMVNVDGIGIFNLKVYYYIWDKDNVEVGDGNVIVRFIIMQE